MALEVEHVSKDLENLEYDKRSDGSFGVGVPSAFRKRMQFIRNASSLQDIRSMKSWIFKRLEGDRDHQHSIRLNLQWRLILEIDERTSPTRVMVIAIEDYH